MPCSLRTRLREEVAPIPAINGRPVISRADMAARGVPPATASTWYRDRDRTGHPEKAGRIGRTDYWYEDEWTAWYQAHQRGKIESLTQVDRGGDPDDLVDAAEAARMLRYASRDVIHANRRLGYFPEPDAYGPARRGRSAPLWKRSTVWAAADSRPGMGGGRKPGTTRQAAPVRRRRAARPRPGRPPLRRPAVRRRPGRGVGRQPAHGRAHHPRGKGPATAVSPFRGTGSGDTLMPPANTSRFEMS